ncbi:MAG: hypothetical protein M1817_003700 [Caeruleum heppii]|nr:MAG: hypothetical protein M1817_003700 [Caeruleum heppii]
MVNFEVVAVECGYKDAKNAKVMFKRTLKDKFGMTTQDATTGSVHASPGGQGQAVAPNKAPAASRKRKAGPKDDDEAPVPKKGRGKAKAIAKEVDDPSSEAEAENAVKKMTQKEKKSIIAKAEQMGLIEDDPEAEVKAEEEAAVSEEE